MKILFLLVVVAIIGYSLWRGMKGPKRDSESLRRPILDLLCRGYNGGLLFIDVPFSRRFVQLRKYISAPGEYGIQLGFPRASWSEVYFDAIHKYCSANKIHFSMTRISEESPLEFIVADFGRDVDRAHDCVKHILLNVFEADEKRGFFVRLENADVEDVLIDGE